MTIFLIPVFAKIFTDLKVPLPALTQFMLFLSGVMRSWLILIPIVTIPATVFLLRRYYKTPMGRLQIDQFFLKMPLFGDLNEKSAVARFCRVFGTLTRSGVLQKANVFPALAIQMISIGEETGELDAMMMKVADFYEDEVEQAVKALTSIIEPLMMVGIAGIVGTILLSMYLPMFKIFDALG